MQRERAFDRAYQDKDSRSVQDKPQQRELFVAGLDENTTQEILMKEFSAFGEINFIKHVSPSSGANPFAFVNYKTEEAAAEALNKMKGARMGEKNISVKYSRPRVRREQERPPRRNDYSVESKMSEGDRYRSNEKTDKWRRNQSSGDAGQNQEWKNEGKWRNDSDTSTPSFAGRAKGNEYHNRGKGNQYNNRGSRGGNYHSRGNNYNSRGNNYHSRGNEYNRGRGGRNESTYPQESKPEPMIDY